jgi:hypothetical protein
MKKELIALVLEITNTIAFIILVWANYKWQKKQDEAIAFICKLVLTLNTGETYGDDTGPTEYH